MESRGNSRGVSRRNFITSTAATTGVAAALQAPLVHAANSSSDQVIRIGVIGCGGRGSGALFDALKTATNSVYPQQGFHTEDVAEGAKVGAQDIEVIALADLFEDRLQRCHDNLVKVGIDLPKSRCFVGFDAYKELLAIPEINYVIQATPPRFRPDHVLAAVKAGKNVFMEKPAGVDAPGIRKIMKAGELAKEKGLGIAAGTQRRHTNSYRETMQRVHDGAIGDIVYGKCYWNGGQIWTFARQPKMSDVEWQIRNWNYFTWLGGDHIVEQHVHNIDIMNWAIGTHPIKAVTGLGGRQVRAGDIQGHIYDHFAVEFEYPGGIRVFSQCRQINGCKTIIGEELVGTDGWSNGKDQIVSNSKDRWRFRGKNPSGYQLEHANLIASIRAGEPINDAQQIVESTMTALLGREACYSGREITWDQAMASETSLGPSPVEFGEFDIPPVAKPGEYKFA